MHRLGNGGGAYESTGGSAGFAFSQNPLDALFSGAPALATVAQDNPGATLMDLVQQGLALYSGHQQQKNFLELNRELIAQGRSPISWDQFGAQTAVGVQLDSNTRTILWVAAGAVLLGALGFFRSRGR